MTSRSKLPIDLSRLENDRIKLVPYEDNIEEWATAYVADSNAHPHVFDWLTYGPFASAAEYLSWYDRTIRLGTDWMLFAILVKPGNVVTRKDANTGEMVTLEVVEDTFAGISGLIGTPAQASAEIGQTLLTGFQRTFVGTNANALLLRYCLDGAERGGLGLRRVQWIANVDNVASVNAGKRLGFKWEGVMRWHQVLPVGKMGDEGTEANREALPRKGLDGSEWGAGRHTAMLSLCWDDWAEGGRDHVDALLRR